MMLAAPISAQDFFKGMEAYQSGDYTTGSGGEIGTAKDIKIQNEIFPSWTITANFYDDEPRIFPRGSLNQARSNILYLSNFKIPNVR